MQLPPAPAGLALAAALAAVMSTSSGALIATATVFSEDIVALLRGRDIVAGSEHDHIRSNRLYVAGFGIVMVVIACALRRGRRVDRGLQLLTAVFASEPIYVGLASGLLVFVVGSLLSKPTSYEVTGGWGRRSRGGETVRREVTDATI